MLAIFRLCLGVLLVCTVGCASTRAAFFSSEPELPPPPILEVNSTELTSLIQDYTVGLKHDEEVNLEQAKIYLDGGIHTIHLEFITQRILDMCEARELIVSMTENLLSRLNLNPVLGPQLSSYPFSPDQVEIYITFESYYGRYVDTYYIHWVCLEDGVVTYYTWDLEDGSKNCWHSRKESYETSREIATYQELAEEEYALQHEPSTKVFGNKRYYPK